MALDTYDGLKAEIAEWLNRQDLATVIPTFVRLLESQVERTLRVREMVTRARAEITEEFTVLPPDFLSIEHAIVNDAKPITLEWVPMNQIDELQRSMDPGPLKFFTIIGDELEVAPFPQSTSEIEVVYYRTIEKLSDTNQTNWLLARHPDLYLYGSLMQAAPYLKNDERVGLWSSALITILEEIRLANERATRGGAPLKMRIKAY